jgi:hypothetical protein
MLFTSAGMGEDWSTHLWQMWRQSLTIGSDHQPSLFLNFSRSVFYPLYAFEGGTIYALAGTLTVMLGNAPVVAYVLTYIIGFGAAYGGWFWLGRMAGLGRWAAQVPGLLFISSGYYLTLIYARGDWPEFVAVSAIPLLVASGLSVLRAKRLEALPGLALAGSTLVFFGSHNITMLWGATMLTVLGVAIAIAVPPARTIITRNGVIRVAGVAASAALVNAWYLLPDLVYASRTSIANVYHYTRELHHWSYLVSAGNLFTPFHTIQAHGTPDFVYALPVVTIAWVLVGLAISLRYQTDGPWRKVLWIVSGLGVLFAIVMTHPGLILDLPRPYTLVQFGFRLETFVLLALSSAVLAILVLARSWPRPWRLGSWAAGAIALVAAGAAALQQVDGYPRARGGHPPRALVADRNTVFAQNATPPATAVGLGCEPGLGCGFDDHSLPLVDLYTGKIAFPSRAVHGQRVTLPIDVPPGAFVRSNLAGAPYLVDVSGAQVVGRDATGHMVLLVSAAKGQSGESISLRPADSLPVVLGRSIALAALAFLALLLLVGVVRRLPIRSTR